MCETSGSMRRMAASPVTTAFVLYKAWLKLPPAQRRMLLQAARRHGPTVAALAAQASRRAVATRFGRR